MFTALIGVAMPTRLCPRRIVTRLMDFENNPSPVPLPSYPSASLRASYLLDYRVLIYYAKCYAGFSTRVGGPGIIRRRSSGDRSGARRRFFERENNFSCLLLRRLPLGEGRGEREEEGAGSQFNAPGGSVERISRSIRFDLSINNRIGDNRDRSARRTAENLPVRRR